MSESKSHKRAKQKAPGKTEVPVPGGRIDSATKKTATQVERNKSSLPNSVSKLKSSRRPHKVLQVPHPLIPDAAAEMKRQKVKGTVKNMSGTKRRSVR
ncbi:MAG: hypothetical protein COZ95_04195 [Nitrospirae bacterium CG_4_8_14_3_um_filter_50_41]|nr:MAG: hypothetical protein COZ95_04195 [Nitrospirae bacterium CG_4_8_14_3_um_filter_50_41]